MAAGPESSRKHTHRIRIPWNYQAIKGWQPYIGRRFPNGNEHRRLVILVKYLQAIGIVDSRKIQTRGSLSFRTAHEPQRARIPLNKFANAVTNRFKETVAGRQTIRTLEKCAAAGLCRN